MPRACTGVHRRVFIEHPVHKAAFILYYWFNNIELFNKVRKRTIRTGRGSTNGQAAMFSHCTMGCSTSKQFWKVWVMAIKALRCFSCPGLERSAGCIVQPSGLLPGVSWTRKYEYFSRIHCYAKCARFDKKASCIGSIISSMRNLLIGLTYRQIEQGALTGQCS